MPSKTLNKMCSLEKRKYKLIIATKKKPPIIFFLLFNFVIKKSFNKHQQIPKVTKAKSSKNAIMKFVVKKLRPN